MQLNLDSAIFIGFLVVTLIVGISSNSKVRTISDYALGGRNFTTGALVATIVATYASASGFFSDLNSTYSDGLFYIIPALCLVISMLIVAYIFVPRMGEFLGNISVAESMGSLYGKEARIITAIAGTIAAVGAIAVQFKAFGNVTGYFIHMPPAEATIISGIIVTLYSALGGVRAVTTTDILQFFTFGFALPLIGIMIWNHMHLDNQSISHILESDNFQISELTNTNNPKFWPMIYLMFYFIMPSLRPAGFQRILIGKNLRQVKKAFIISAALLALVILATCWISFLVLNVNDTLAPNQLLGFIIDKYTYDGLRGLIVIGVIAMSMSTADSILNATAVLFSHDILAPLNIGVNRQLAISKVFSLTLGLFAISFALYGQDFLGIILAANSFYMPVVTGPLILAILGFRTSKKSVLIAMASGLTTVITIKTFSFNADPIFWGMITNIIFLFGTHYCLNQEGGWVGMKDKESYKQLVIDERMHRAKKSINYKDFSFIQYCKKIAPNNEISYTGLGVYFIIFTITTMYSTQSVLLTQSRQVVLAIYQIMMITGVIIAMYPIWPLSIKRETKQIIAQIAWPVTTFYMLVLFNIFFMLISNFALLQFAVFSINLIISSVLVGWRLSSIMIMIGLSLIWLFYDTFFKGYNIDFSIGSPGFICTYIVTLIATTFVIFIKPKQEYQELTEEKVDHLNGRISLQEKEVQDAWNLRSEFIRNISHEYHAPMTGIYSMTDALIAGYHRFDDKTRLGALQTILKSALRLEVFDSNISSLAVLSKAGYKLNLQSLNLSELVYERVEAVHKLYEENQENREFIFDVEENITINADKFYLVQTLDNLIVNAITYCKEGKITVSLKKSDKGIEFAISDEGIGIPVTELRDIFGEFVVSSKTRTQAGYRGVGLALCKKVIETHGGTIKAESNGIKGARLSFVLPRKLT